MYIQFRARIANVLHESYTNILLYTITAKDVTISARAKCAVLFTYPMDTVVTHSALTFAIRFDICDGNAVIPVGFPWAFRFQTSSNVRVNKNTLYIRRSNLL